MLDLPDEVNHSDDNEADLTNIRNGNHHDLTPLQNRETKTELCPPE